MEIQVAQIKVFIPSLEPIIPITTGMGKSDGGAASRYLDSSKLYLLYLLPVKGLAINCECLIQVGGTNSAPDSEGFICSDYIGWTPLYRSEFRPISCQAGRIPRCNFIGMQL